MPELATININVDVDRLLIDEAGKALSAKGVTLTEALTEAVNDFLRQTVQEKKTAQTREEALALFEQMRTKVVQSGDFMTNEEINAEIKDTRTQRKGRVDR